MQGMQAAEQHHQASRQPAEAGVQQSGAQCTHQAPAAAGHEHAPAAAGQAPEHPGAGPDTEEQDVIRIERLHIPLALHTAAATALVTQLTVAAWHS